MSGKETTKKAERESREGGECPPMQDENLHYWATQMMGLQCESGSYYRGNDRVSRSRIREAMNRGLSDFARWGS